MSKSSPILIEPHKARDEMMTRANPMTPENVGLRKSLGLVLAQEVVPLIDQPPFDNSSMDGYAVISSDLIGASKESPVILKIIERIQAGQNPRAEITPGFASKIMTGAPIPKGADAIVMVEDTESDGDIVSIFTEVEAGSYIRRTGEDLSKGQAILMPGLLINPARVGLAAASGLSSLMVYPRPKVGIIVTGEEIVEPGFTLPPGKIYNSNGYTLYNQVIESGAEPVEYGIAGDKLSILESTIQRAFTECDLVLTSGGVSMGDYDLVEDAVKNIGATIHFSKISQRPGKPLVGATRNNKLFFGLPGNPVSVMVCFEIYVRPVIRKMLGRKHFFRPRCIGVFEESFQKKKGLTFWSRVNVEWGKELCRLRPSAPQGSGILRSMAFGDGLAELPAQLDVIPPDLKVIVHLFEDWNQKMSFQGNDLSEGNGK